MDSHSLSLSLTNNNLIDMSGEAALVVAARGGQSNVLRQLLSIPHPPPSLSQQAAALYAASRAGQLDAVKYLIDFGVNIDVGIPEPPLIGALIGGYTDVAIFLIHHGADCDIKDLRGNSCLHLACSAGIYDVVRALCSLGCVQGPNLRGQYPLHIAARNGYIHIVRLLCFYGCKLDQRNGDGIRADITALKYGHNNVAELLDKLRAGTLSTTMLRSQLLPGSRPLARPQVKFLGHSGSGKSALAASLKAGLLHALFRRSTSLTSRSRPSSPCQTSQIEMDVTPRHNSLSFDSCSTPNYVPTKGVQVHQMDLNGVGDITVWDFSGQESYFQIFHHFLSDINIPQPSTILSNLVAKSSAKSLNSNEIAKYTAANDNVITNIGKMQNDPGLLDVCTKSSNCGLQMTCNKNKYAQMFVYVITFSLEKPYNVQLQQCTFWINFIISRLSPCNITGGLGNIILVGSHADLRAHKTAQGDFVYPAGETLLQSIRSLYGSFFQIHNQVLALDCNASTSVGLRNFKSYLASVKRSVTQGSGLTGRQRTTVFGSEYDLIHESPVQRKLSCQNDKLRNCLFILKYHKILLNNIHMNRYQSPPLMIVSCCRPLIIAQFHIIICNIFGQWLDYPFTDQHVQVAVGNWNGFLENTLSWIVNVRKSLDAFPVMDKDAFMSNIRIHVNLLASDEHIIDVIHHLHVIGEILVMGNLIVLCCDWLARILGTLFGKDGLQDARALGVYTAHDFQAHFGYCDATQLLELLQELRLCTMCEIDDEIEYEFPCFNLIETLDGLWDPDDLQYQPSDACYGGLRLCQPRGVTHLTMGIFPHIQVELRDHIESLKTSDNEGWNIECDLYQWWQGSKLCWGPVECLLMLNGANGCESLDLKIRAPPGSGITCFALLEKLLRWINQAIGRVAPGLTLERHILSAQQLKLHHEEPFSWTSRQINTELLNHDENDNDTPFSTILLTNSTSGKKESLLSLMFFDCSTIDEITKWGPRIPVRDITGSLLAKLGALLDPPHPLGAHWCMLAVSLGVNQDTIAAFDSETEIWHTSKLLSAVNCNIGALVRKLTSLGRTDAAEEILSLIPLYSVVDYDSIDIVKLEEDKAVSQSLSKSSTSKYFTLSPPTVYGLMNKFEEYKKDELEIGTVKLYYNKWPLVLVLYRFMTNVTTGIFSTITISASSMRLKPGSLES
ncbi:death-associated protein kinase 1-like [Arctopsyche grandis]|uniref:death-associated protein kinase 1-like n=1 Tax=Arctopsyche grandis TaxID=121162 RepID=UPI00406D74B8